MTKIQTARAGGFLLNALWKAAYVLYWIVTLFWHVASQRVLSFFNADENSKLNKTGQAGCRAFTDTPDDAVSARICAVGDLIFEKQVLEYLQRSIDKIAAENPDIDEDEAAAKAYLTLFEGISDYLKGDIVYGNLETALGKNLGENILFDDGIPKTLPEDIKPYTLYHKDVYYERLLPSLNNHPALAAALKRLGFNILSTANNHMWDRLSNGIDETLRHLDMAGISHTGAIPTEQALSGKNGEPFKVIDANGIKVAFLSYTQRQNLFFRNYAPLDPFSQVRRFSGIFPNYSYYSHIDDDIRKARLKSDLVAVSAHWGMEITHFITRKQRRWAEGLCEAGADIILGHHPHALQPVQRYKASDGRNCIIIYSMGNFVAGIPREVHLLSAIFNIDIFKNGSKAQIAKISFIPTYTMFKGSRVSPEIMVVPAEKTEASMILARKALSIIDACI